MSDLAARVAAGFRDARSRLDEQEKGCREVTFPESAWAFAGSPYLAILDFVAVVRRQLDALEWIAELHHDDRGYCWNCDHSDWPCPTFDLVAAGLGIEL
jgi:hypothetical protein